MRPLDGITVVSLEHAVAAPICTRHLADLGARVIKVERPGGGDFARAYDTRAAGMSSHFVWANRSKESLALDLKSSADMAVLKRLLCEADVFVQNLAPGATERMGLSYDVLASAHPELIVCDISGYGSSGPYKDKKAYDLLIQGESGFLSITGTEQEPAKAGISIADIAAGMYAYSNILACLLQRSKTKKGAHIEISMLECMVEWMGFPLYYTLNGADPLPRTGTAHASIYPYGLFSTGDGASLMFGIQNEREWQLFCEDVLGRPELAADDRFSSSTARSASRSVLRDIICEAFSTQTRAEVQARLDEAMIANASVRSMSEVWNHPQLLARDRWVDVDTPVGKLPALLPPGIPAEFPPRMDSVPAVGQHNKAILHELNIERPSAGRRD